MLRVVENLTWMEVRWTKPNLQVADNMLMRHRKSLTTAAAFAVLAIGGTLVAEPACAENYAFEFNNEVKQGEQRAGFTNKVMVKTATFTVGAIAVNEIKPHRHKDGSHVLYVVSGGGK